MKRICISVVALLWFTFSSVAQVGIGTDNPHSSASLELSSPSKGLLINRMTEDQRNSITSPAKGLVVYQTNGDEGLWFFNGTKWIQMAFVEAGGSVTHNYGIVSNYYNGNPMTVTGQSGTWLPYNFFTTPGQLINNQGGSVTVNPGSPSLITVAKDGVYNIMVTMSLMNASQSDCVDFSVFKNGIGQPFLSVQFNVPNGSNSYANATITGIIPLVAGDNLSLKFKQLTNGGNRSFDISTMTFSIVRFD